MYKIDRKGEWEGGGVQKLFSRTNPLTKAVKNEKIKINKILFRPKIMFKIVRLEKAFI